MKTGSFKWVPLGGPFLAFAAYYLGSGLEPNQRTFLAIFAFVVFNWLTAVLPLFVTGLLGVSLSVLAGVENASSALASFSHPIIFLFLTGFLYAKAMGETGLDKRISLFILSREQVSRSFDRLLFCLFALTAIFSMWVSNTATAAMMLPILTGVSKSLNIQDRKTQSLMLLGLAYSASVGGLGSPVGSPPNVIAMGMLDQLAGIKIGFFEWTLFGFPLAVFFLCLIFFYVKKRIPAESKKLDPEFIKAQASKLAPIGAREKTLAGLFFVLLACWFLPGLLNGLLGQRIPLFQTLEERMEPGTIGLLLAGALFMFPFGRESKLLEAEDVKAIDWGSLLLFGSGLALGKILFSTGLAQLAGDLLVESLADSGYLVLIASLCFFTVFSTELASNTASANILIPIVIASAQTLGIAPQFPAVAVALACSLAFMLPVATPPNAIVYGTGLVEIPQMIRFGFILNILCAGALSLIFYFLNIVL